MPKGLRKTIKEAAALLTPVDPFAVKVFRETDRQFIIKTDYKDQPSSVLSSVATALLIRS